MRAKKYRVFSTAVFLFAVSSVFSAAASAGSGTWPEGPVPGKWELMMDFCETDEGRLIDGSADYAFPFRAITIIEVLDDEFLIVEYRGGRFRAFYTLVPGDAGNFELEMQFRDGRTLLVKLAGVADGRYRYLYRIPNGFFEPDTSASDPVPDGAGYDEIFSVEAVEEALEAETEPVEIPVFLYSGTMERME